MRISVVGSLPGFLAAALALFPADAEAVDLKGTAGYTTFLDESPVDHLFTGASARFYLTQRLALEPEFVFLYRDRTDKDVGAQMNVSWDFGRRGRVVPYVIGGVGVLRTIFPRFSSNEWMFSGGGGAKIYLNDRWFVAPEARLGLEPIVRLTVSVGYSFQ